jgi:exopolysaccharide production protein ExoZ
MFSNIQALRAFAAINVILFHVISIGNTYPGKSNYFQVFDGWGANGVDIFFVISGFIMLYTQMTRRKSPLDFIKSRALRIIPIYWLITIFVALLYFALPTLFRSKGIDPFWLLSSLFFSSSLFFETLPLVYLGWSLEWEMLFYVVFALALFIQPWNRVVIFVGAAILLISVISGNSIVIEFFLGIIIAYVFHKKTFSHRLGIASLVIGFMLLLLSLLPAVQALKIDRLLIWGLPSFLIVLGAVYSPQIKSEILVYLGDASYSIYLVQMMTIPAFFKLASKLFIGWNGDLLAIACLLTSVIFGVIFYNYIEKPLTAYLRRFSN